MKTTTIGARIKARRQELKMTQRYLAARMGYKDHTTITRTEAGKVDLPQSRIAQFAEVLGVTPGYLLGWDEPTDTSTDDIQKNDVAVDIVVRLGSDPDFCDVVKLLYKLDAEQITNIKNMLSGFIK